MDTAPASQVRKRRVFYIPGYDPIPPRRYRELYRSECAEQSKISGYEVALSPRPASENFGWSVTGKMDGAQTEAEIDVLIWSDIVRESMSHTVLGTYGQLIRTAWTYIATGALRRLMWLRKGPVIAALYPVGMLILQLLLAVLAGHFAGRVLAWIVGFLPLGSGGTGLAVKVMLEGVAYYVPLFVIAVLVLRWFKRMDGKFYAYYLMHDYAYSARWKGANPPELETRMGVFRAQIAAALRSDADEVLVVGHSSGAHLGVSILADLIRAGEMPANGPALGFLSLGQVVPMLSFLPDAHRLRADLHYLCQRKELTWVDVTAPGDGCAFALCDPVAVSGVEPEQGKRWPLVISAAFTQTLSPERWQELRWKFFRLHFQYLCAFDQVGDYDYFRITAGPMTLAERFAERQPSKSRIDVPASKYTHMVA